MHARAIAQIDEEQPTESADPAIKVAGQSIRDGTSYGKSQGMG